MAKNEGKKFEEDFKNSMPEDVYFYRLRDSASAFGQNNSNSKVRFTPKNDYDCLMYKFPYFFPVELKSTKQSSIGLEREKGDKKSIKLSQIEGLEKSSKFKGVQAGFLLNFRELEETYWLDIKDFLRFYNTEIKKSINRNDVINYNGILCKGMKKRVRYRYNIQNLIEKIINVEKEWFHNLITIRNKIIKDELLANIFLQRKYKNNIIVNALNRGKKAKSKHWNVQDDVWRDYLKGKEIEKMRNKKYKK